MSDSKGFLARLREFDRPKSPKVSRKMEPPKLQEIKSDMSKISQNEVEEKLKLMRQKRLSRLNVHVEEQSKLSETRNVSKSADNDDIEVAIASIQRQGNDKQTNFESIPEDDVEIRSPTEKATLEWSKKPSSTKKFINKLSCMNHELTSSAEDLTKETYVTPIRKSLPNRFDNSRLQTMVASKSSSNISEDDSFVTSKDLWHSNSSVTVGENSSVKSFSENSDSSNYTKDLFSRTLEDNLQNEQYPQRTVTHETFGKARSIDSPTSPMIREANFLDEDTPKKTDEPIVTVVESIPSVSEAKTFYENVSLGKNVTDEVKLKNVELKTRNIKSPLPIPRRNTREDRILKKFQASLITLNEILRNDSEVDYDEIEGFKHILEEVTNVLDEYKTKLHKLEDKFVPMEKLRRIRLHLEEVRHKVKHFRGLKRDVTYLELSNKLSTYFFETKNDISTDIEVVEERQLVLDEINRCIRILEARVEKNEGFLVAILEEQVLSIQTKRIVPTIV